MRRYRILALVFILSLVFIPYFTVLLRGGGQGRKKEKTDSIADMEILVYRTASKKVEKMRCYDYICGVVSGEMQANSAPEALKAQAVAAFTYTVNKMEYAMQHPGGDGVHSGAYVCDDYSHCKAYLGKSDARKKWGGEWFEEYYPNIESAVKETMGKTVTCDGQPINAVFHAISNGTTCSAAEVWGADVPYLQSVECPDDANAPGYESEAVFSKEEFSSVFENELGIRLPEDSGQWLAGITKTRSGMVDQVNIAGTLYEGTHIRRLFSLRSASFDISVGDDVRFTVRGYGHGVGMSQNEANKMAEKGKTYEEILTYFYTGVKIEDYKAPKKE